VKTAVVVPCHNEERRLDVHAFRALLSTRSDLAFLMVNDGSDDGTMAMLEDLRRSRPEAFQIIDLPQNRGKAEAVRRGISESAHWSPRYVAFWDADLATPLEAIPLFEEVLDDHPQVDLVMGSRVKLLGRSVVRSELRHYLGRVFATVASMTLRLGVYDTQCGAKMFRYSDQVREIFHEPFLARWIFDVEILARMIRQGGPQCVEASVYELPLLHWKQVEGSKLRATDFARALLDLYRIRRRYLRVSP
jgi:glycosyltransferase involved in cell wall biosynthesis